MLHLKKKNWQFDYCCTKFNGHIDTNTTALSKVRYIIFYLYFIIFSVIRKFKLKFFITHKCI